MKALVTGHNVHPIQNRRCGGNHIPSGYLYQIYPTPYPCLYYDNGSIRLTLRRTRRALWYGRMRVVRDIHPMLAYRYSDSHIPMCWDCHNTTIHKWV